MAISGKIIAAFFLSIVSSPPAVISQAQGPLIPVSRFLTGFPFRQFSGGVIIIRATLNDHPDSLNLILDTGCGGVSLDSATCAQLKLPLMPSDVTVRGIAGIRKVDFSRNNTLHLPGLSVPALNFHINDYEILTNVYGEHIDGIIGYSFFNRYIVKINYDTRRIEVFTQGTIKYPRGGFLLKTHGGVIPVQSGEITENRPVQTRFYLDIGAGLCLLLSEDFVRDSLRINSRKPIHITQVEGVGGKATMRLTTLRRFRLGPYKFRKIPTYIFEDLYDITQYPFLGGLIGNDLMRRFNVIVNYERKELHLTPNKHYREKFDYSYTGMGFYYFGDAVCITDIVRRSPAEKAGLKPGDIILGMDNMLGKDIQEYKSLLLQTGKTIKVFVMRNGVPLQLKLKIGNIRK